MRNRFLPGLVLLAVSLFLACTQRSEIVLPPDEILIDLIYDLHLAESSMTRVDGEKQDSIASILRERIATSYGITAEQMDTWLESLQRSPDHLLLVYDSVIARFEKNAPKQTQ